MPLPLTLGVGDVEFPAAGGSLALALTLGVAEVELLAGGTSQLGGCLQPGSSAESHEPPPSPSHHAQPSVAWQAVQLGRAGHQAAAHSSATGPPAPAARQTPPLAASQFVWLAGPAGDPGQHHMCGPSAADCSHQPQPASAPTRHVSHARKTWHAAAGGGDGAGDVSGDGDNDGDGDGDASDAGEGDGEDDAGEAGEGEGEGDDAGGAAAQSAGEREPGGEVVPGGHG